LRSNQEIYELLKEYKIRQARESFWEYRKLLNRKLKTGWWQEEIARQLQCYYEDLVNGLKPKLVIQAPPQHGKSTQILDFVGWLAGKNPDLRTIYTSFSEDLGIRANLYLQRLFDSEIYQSIFPGTMIEGNQNSDADGKYLRNQEILQYINREGYFRNTTVRGSITGQSLDLGILDDPIKGREAANSQTVRDRVWDWFTDDFFTRFSEDAGMLCILTRWHVDDPIGRLLEIDKDVKLLSYPAIAVEDEDHRKRGEALFPELKSLDFLERRQKVMSGANWSALYQQKPFVVDGEVFKPGNIEIVDAIPTALKFVRGWDLAATKDDGDYTATIKIGIATSGIIYIVDAIRERGAPDQVERLINNTVAVDGRLTQQSLPQDPGQAGKAQAAYLSKQLSGYRFEFTTESGDKTTRAYPIASQINAGNVKMLRSAWNGWLLEELRYFPNGKNDDGVDALSRAYNKASQSKRGFFG
jgi:predicted phage terminase large subunit-like protein